jgi:hypothetical protein
VAATLVLAGAAGPARANAVVEWNAFAAQNLTGSNPLPHTRELAILHVAIYDAVVSITRDHAPYRYAVMAPAGASAEAAAIRAAHDVLVAFHPGNAVTLDAQYAASLSAIPDGPAKTDGLSVGQQVAAAVLGERAGDGYDLPPPTIFDGTAPYEWRRTDPAPPPVLPQFAGVTPWVIGDAARFLPEPPPALTSRRYARDLDEVKAFGSATSAVRPPHRTDIAVFHLRSHPDFWNEVARQICGEEPRGLSQTARVFAVLNTAMMDSYVGAWHAKWDVYYNWRPVTAIRLADTDGNDRTDADPAWTPLRPTPMHPTYPSGHAVGAGSAFAVLQRFFGRSGHALDLTSATAPGVTLTYDNLRDVVTDVHNARVDLGVHFRFDVDAAHRLGVRTARFVLANAFRPVRGRHDGDDHGTE